MRLRPYVLAALLGLTAASSGCAGTTSRPVDPVVAARRAAADSTDGDVLGRWLLTELVAPGGSAQQARAARTRLDDVARKDRGLYASLARGLDDEAHGQMTSASHAYLATLEAARKHAGPESSIVASYATTRLIVLRANVANLWKSAKPIVEKSIAEPGAIGARARGDLVEWWAHETRRDGGVASKDVDRRASEELGCIEHGRFAGPFGRPGPLDVVTRFDAEKPGVWPHVFAKHPARTEAPHVSKAERSEGLCNVRASDPSGVGIFYVETFVELEHPADLLLSVRAAWSVLVDDVEVLAHDPRSFGTWTTSNVALRLGAGRHRIVGRLGMPETQLRITDLRGMPMGVKGSGDSSAPYSLEAPRVLENPTALGPFYASASVARPKHVPPSKGPAVDPSDPVLRLLAAELSHFDGSHDLATVLVEPLVKQPSRATPLSLAQAAMFITDDPVFTPNDARDVALDYRRRAIEKDARLWYPQLWLMADAAAKQGEKDQLLPLAQLALDFPEVATVGKALANAYSRLGYRAEQRRSIVDLAKRFPDDVELMRLLLALYDDEGKRAEADAIAKRIEALEPESTITVERAIAKNDLEEAGRLLRKSADDAEGVVRKRLLRRVADLLVRAGKSRETRVMLEQALAEEPSNSRANLDLADAQLAAGDHAALRRALAHALRVGADTTELRDAIEAVDGATELESFRRDPWVAIREFEDSGAAAAGLASTKGGTAARVLDYAAVWVHEDGTARMLEHEILFMQSEEAIKEHAEQPLPRGKLLRIRVVTKDGHTFEPEIVSGKPTVTMAPLSVGDYIETETIFDLQGSGSGQAFVSPRWFFREERVDYHHSEFVIIAPKDKPFVIETTGKVPEPKVEPHGTFVVRSWRMDKTPALPNERFSAPASEFLPTVRAGWGVSQNEMLRRLLDASTRLEPADPRLVRIAKTIVTNGAPPERHDAELAKIALVERAHRLYRWVLDNIEPSRETDPRKSVVGKSGSRLEAFLYLCRLAGVDARHAIVRDRLRAPAVGPFTEAELFTEIAVAIPDGKGNDVWTVVADKYAPFGYLPSSMRGQPAVILRPELPRVTTGESGPPDGVVHKGKAVLSADGSARIKIDQSYTGRLAIVLREQIQKIADEEKLRSAIESELLSDALPGARLVSIDVLGMNDLDSPLVLRLDVEVNAFAQKSRGALIVPPPFASTIHLGTFAQLESRETPLVIPPGAALRIEVDMEIELPKGAKADAVIPPSKKENDGRAFEVQDTLKGSSYIVHRTVDVPAGRVAPEKYAAFVSFAREADEALHRDIVVRLP